MMTGSINEFPMFSISFVLPMMLDLFFKQIFDSSSAPRFDISIKDKVNFLFRLGEEELEGQHKTENAKDDIRLPLDVCKGGNYEM